MRDRTHVFRVARRAGMRAAPSPFSALGITAIAIGLLGYVVAGTWTEWRAGGPAFSGDSALFVLTVLAIGALPAISAVRETSTVLRMRWVWRRAEHGEVRQALDGVALPQWRSVADRPVRTVVARINGRVRFVRLAFASDADAAALAPGPVRVELFDGPSIRGPARLRQPYGMALAFASRIGDFAVEEDTVLELENDWLNEWSDGWPDSDDSAERCSGWPGDGDGGDGDGDGGE